MRTALLSVLLILLALTAPVAAQEAPNGTDVPSAAEQAENATAATTEASEETVEYRGSVDETLRIRSVSYEDGTMTVTVEADVPKLVVMSAWSSASAAGEGVHSVPQSKTSISSGVTELQIEAQPDDGEVSVSVATNRGAVLITRQTGTQWFEGVPSWDTVMGAGAVAALVGAALPALVAYRRKRSEQDQIRRIR